MKKQKDMEARSLGVWFPRELSSVIELLEKIRDFLIDFMEVGAYEMPHPATVIGPYIEELGLVMQCLWDEFSSKDDIPLIVKQDLEHQIGSLDELIYFVMEFSEVLNASHSYLFQNGFDFFEEHVKDILEFCLDLK